MGSGQEAQAAIGAFLGKEHEGHTLTVNEARPMNIMWAEASVMIQLLG